MTYVAALVTLDGLFFAYTFIYAMSRPYPRAVRAFYGFMSLAHAAVLAGLPS